MEKSKKLFLLINLIALIIIFVTPPTVTAQNFSNSYEYVVTGDSLFFPVETPNHAPALQSFVMGVNPENKSEWLLFAGRTNNPKDSLNGGLHNTGDTTFYGGTSFPPLSFNDDIFVYDVALNLTLGISVGEFLDILPSINPSLINPSLQSATLKEIFICTNPLFAQQDSFLYVVGGYGPDFCFDSANDSIYFTRNTIARIHIPAMIEIIELWNLYLDANVKKDRSKLLETFALLLSSKSDQFSEVILYNQDYIPCILGGAGTGPLAVTGGELLIINDTFYLAGGHNFSVINSSHQQIYTCQVLAFTIDTANASIVVNVHNSISDNPEPLGILSQQTSIFRRRDVPIVPSVFFNPKSHILESGISIYGGVFRYNKDDDIQQGWNNAIHVHPSWSDNYGNRYNYDFGFNQNNWNIYKCADFVGYDTLTNTLHTFLIGGIGDGTDSLQFTNTYVHNQVDAATMMGISQVCPNFFPAAGNSYFGAEAVMIPNPDLNLVIADGLKTAVIDLEESFDSQSGSILTGYIYGGIKAFQPNPGTYGIQNGAKLSAATNTIWKVYLTRVPAH